MPARPAGAFRRAADEALLVQDLMQRGGLRSAGLRPAGPAGLRLQGLQPAQGRTCEYIRNSTFLGRNITAVGQVQFYQCTYIFSYTEDPSTRHCLKFPTVNHIHYGEKQFTLITGQLYL